MEHDAVSLRRDTSPGNKGKWRPRVSIERESYLGLRASLLNLATHRSEENLEREFKAVHFEPYKPVWRQLATILRGVNAARHHAGYSKLGYDVLRHHQRRLTVFVEEEGGADLAA